MFEIKIECKTLLYTSFASLTVISKLYFTHMVLVECVDHRGVDVVDGDTEHNDSHILADSRNEGNLVVHSYRHISVPRCDSHLSF